MCCTGIDQEMSDLRMRVNMRGVNGAKIQEMITFFQNGLLLVNDWVKVETWQ